MTVQRAYPGTPPGLRTGNPVLSPTAPCRPWLFRRPAILSPCQWRASFNSKPFRTLSALALPTPTLRNDTPCRILRILSAIAYPTPGQRPSACNPRSFRILSALDFPTPVQRPTSRNSKPCRIIRALSALASPTPGQRHTSCNSRTCRIQPALAFPTPGHRHASCISNPFRIQAALKWKKGRGYLRRRILIAAASVLMSNGVRATPTNYLWPRNRLPRIRVAHIIPEYGYGGFYSRGRRGAVISPTDIRIRHLATDFRPTGAPVTYLRYRYP